MLKINVLAFGAHPDDVELGCAGALFVEKQRGQTIGIVDLTEGELGTRGTVETRYTEAAAASAVLGLQVRKNLKMADGFFTNNVENQLKIITVLRTYQPDIIFINAPEDRHPDHGRAHQLLTDAAFLSGLRKIETFEDGKLQTPWRPKYVFAYVQDRYLEPNFVLDISSVMAKKLEAIKAYTTQFSNGGSEPSTYISAPGFLDSIIYRAKMFGKMIGVEYAEGFISKKIIGLTNLETLIKNET
jgi:N-acetylglucosamine malate deacetylase 1